ncbi:hypothetical protein [Oceaniglobus trochenteri]|uniref:hypothetical protein n=1 Tax=Oceaniglobus trochenteri TaxID=2763260 RepID=UPI001D000C33|nr:hypothetical protein [Oceaniglobus trochenteri]
MTLTDTPWLWRAYVAALVIYGVLFAFLLLGAGLWTWSTAGMANAARHDALFAVLGFLTVALPAVIPLIPLASFLLLRRRGLWPSPGHQVIAIVGVVLFAGLILVTGVLA